MFERELALIDEVAPLLGDTPRSVKRFVNVHLLVESMGRHHGWDAADLRNWAGLARRFAFRLNS